MKQNRLDETTISVEDINVLEIGGARNLDISKVVKSETYTVTNVTGKKTEWGLRVDFTIRNDYDEFILSSWNIVTSKKIKPMELLGKKIVIEPTGNPKKVNLIVLEQ